MLRKGWHDTFGFNFPMMPSWDVKNFFKTFTFSRKTKFLIAFGVYWHITYTFCPFIRECAGDVIKSNPLFFLYFSAGCLFGNIFISRKWNEFKFRKPLDFTQFSYKNILLKFNFILLQIKKFYNFFVNVMFLKNINIIINLYRFFFSKFIMWNPLFKKTSYLSFYKSFSSRFLK